ncbi:GNAT family N-acetyltransferase [Brevibacillus daliensis]|uniref:GNAT family N-acetyltransferase n=1 Tax=Brevibacillus daliensis TaxID=2892995 RepID=UPI001E382DE0|nr:GNAT family N-acetyltransferase [Brevibacillus daliensis]
MFIRKLEPTEQPPIDLLLLADPSRRLVEEYILRGDCYIGELEQVVVGVYVLLPTRPDTVELVNVAVMESYHGNGFGKQLVLHAIQQAKSSGYRTIEVGTGNSSVNQLALYQKCGFRLTGIDRDFFLRHYDEELLENGIQIRDMVRLSMDFH